MQYSGDLQNMGGDSFYNHHGGAAVAIENYVYPQKADTFVEFGEDINRVLGHPGERHRVAYHSALTEAMLDHLRDVLPTPIIHIGERANNFGTGRKHTCESEYATVDRGRVKVPIALPDGLITIPVEIVSVQIPSYTRVTYPNDDYYDMGPAALTDRGGVYYSPVEAFLGSAHDQFAGKDIQQGYIAKELHDDSTRTPAYEHLETTACPICGTNLVIIDARLAAIRMLKQELTPDSYELMTHRMKVRFQLIYELFWVCEECDTELFGWDPCPEVIWT